MTRKCAYLTSEGFVCTSRKHEIKSWTFDAWEIVTHLKIDHKIPRKLQKISGWNKEFEKEYLKKENELKRFAKTNRIPISTLRKEKIKEYEFEPSVNLDKTPSREYEKEKERKLREYETNRDHW